MPKQFFNPYPWQEMILPELRRGDLVDIPDMGLARSRSSINGLADFPDNQKRMWTAYYAAVTFMDQQVGRIGVQPTDGSRIIVAQQDVWIAVAVQIADGNCGTFNRGSSPLSR